MSNIGLNCDVCGRTVQGCIFVNGMKFCAKCYQETFGNKTNDYAQYSEQLKQKNAQLEQENKQLKERIQNILEGKEIPAICAKKYEEYEEQLQEQIDYKEEYYHYWQETKKQLAIREKAFELALTNLYYADKEYYIGTAPAQEEYVEQKTKYWIEQAKESL